MDIVAVIPARGGSKGIPKKNLAPLRGLPLIAYTIMAARSANLLARWIVSTDDPEIEKVSGELGAEVLIRPKELAQDETPTLLVLQHVVKMLAESQGYQPDAIMTLQPTSPLRTSRHIDEAIELFESDPKADSLVSCVEVPHIFHPRSVMRIGKSGYLESYLPGRPPTRRQRKERVFARNGAAIYITRTDRLSEYIFGGKLLCYLMEPEASIDIDTPGDLRRVESRLDSRLRDA